MKKLPPPGPTFTVKKRAILAQLALPDEAYTDASPKGSVDAGIRDLIGRLNAHAGLVTTSSCAGRVSVYLEGEKGRKTAAAGEEEETVRGSGGVAASSAGGKGGGEWLFVSHDPVVAVGKGKGEAASEAAGEEDYEGLLGLRQALAAGVVEGAVQCAELDAASRLIHFKFEPMILHVLTASLEHAQLVIQAGMEAGFRETGAVSLLKRQPDEEATPIVAVRSMGLSFESLIGVDAGGVRRPVVSRQYLKTLVQIANERFVENEKRIARFSAALDAAFSLPKGKEGWEDAQARRERKREEGLRRREELRKTKREATEQPDVDFTIQQPDVV